MNKIFAVVFAATCSISVGAALAQSASNVSPLSPIYACAEKTDPTQRLACFDAAVAQVKAAESRSEIIALDQPRVAAVRREAFGFRIPSLPKFGFGGGAAASGTSNAAAGTPSAQQASTSNVRDEDIEEQTFAVSRVSAATGRATIYLENGNIWQLTESGEFNAPSRTPYNVRIRSAAMGSYILQVEGRNKGYRVRRVQ
jgi:hypothetical protein